MDSEFHCVDLETDLNLATIANEFNPEPEPYRWYRYCINELLEKVEPSELLSKASRMVELKPNMIEAYKYRFDVLRELGDQTSMERDVDRVAKLLDETFGSGSQDKELRIARDRSCLSLFGNHPEQHRLFAEHMTSEYRVKTEGRGRTVDEWKIRPERSDNHWLDCLVGCAVAASMQGCVLFGTDGQTQTQRGRVSFKELQRKKHA